MKKYDAAIIGAGASGLTAGLSAAESGASVIIIDGNEKAGKKLYATGNGRCNFTNINIEGADRTIEFFRKLGMMSRVEDDGRCYPYSGQAAALVNILESAVRRAGAEIKTNDRAVSIRKADTRFIVECESGVQIVSKTVIIATGGRAGLKFGSTGDGYGFAKSFGHTLTPPRPALVPVESDDTFIKLLKGIRAKADVTLILDGNTVAKESGEVQFTGTGISGICVFDLTRFMDAARPVKKNHKSDRKPEKAYIITADFVPDHSEDDIMHFLSVNAAPELSRESIKKALSGIVNMKLSDVLADMAWIPDNAEKSVRRAVHLLKHLKINVSHTKGWDDAQVTAGGVHLEDVDLSTMESRIEKGLFFCGEVLDYDGRCGGYNLQWAWESGYIAGNAAAGK
jgi:hypothetical protein